MTDKI